MPIWPNATDYKSMEQAYEASACGGLGSVLSAAARQWTLYVRPSVERRALPRRAELARKCLCVVRKLAEYIRSIATLSLAGTTTCLSSHTRPSNVECSRPQMPCVLHTGSPVRSGTRVVCVRRPSPRTQGIPIDHRAPSPSHPQRARAARRTSASRVHSAAPGRLSSEGAGERRLTAARTARAGRRGRRPPRRRRPRAAWQCARRTTGRGRCP